MTEPHSRIRIAPDVLYQSVDDESVLLNLGNDHFYALDDVGTRMWQILVDTGQPEAVVAQMVREYKVDAETMRRDLDKLIEELRQAGLVADEPLDSSPDLP